MNKGVKILSRTMVLRGFIGAILLLLPVGLFAGWDSLVPWRWLVAGPTTVRWFSIQHNGQRFVGVPFDHPTFESINGHDWKIAGLIPESKVGQVGFVPSGMAVSPEASMVVDADGVVFFARPGTSWEITARTGVQGLLFRGGLTYASGRFLMSTSTTNLISSDGRQWSPVAPPVRAGTVASDGITFALMGANRTLFLSTNAVDWLDVTPTDAQWKRVSSIWRGGDRWFAAGANELFFTSTNGSDWTLSHPASTTGPFVTFGNVIQLDGNYWVGSGNRWLHSSDGQQWEKIQAGPTNGFASGFAAGAGVAVAYFESGQLQTSTNFLDWVPVDKTPRLDALAPVVQSGHATLVLSYQSSGYLASTNDVDWRFGTFGPGFASASAAVHDDVFIVVGSKGSIARSTNLVDWTRQPSGTSTELRSVTYLDDQFVAAGDSGTILTSKDGLEWTPRAVGVFPSGSLHGATRFHGKLYVIDWQTRNILTSADGLDWHLLRPSAAGWSGGFDTIASSDRLLVLTGLGATLVSSDGENFTPSFIPNYGNTRSIAYGNGYFLILSDNGTFRFSSNGVDWQRIPFTADAGLGCCFANGRFRVSTYRGGLLESPPVVSLRPGLTRADPLELFGEMGGTYVIEQSTHPGLGTPWTERESVTVTTIPQRLALPNPSGFYRARSVEK